MEEGELEEGELDEMDRDLQFPTCQISKRVTTRTIATLLFQVLCCTFIVFSMETESQRCENVKEDGELDKSDCTLTVWNVSNKRCEIQPQPPPGPRRKAEGKRSRKGETKHSTVLCLL